MKFDVLGRIRNMQLPDGRTALLYSVYEAISNAIQAIEERFGKAEFAKRGIISIMAQTNPDKTLKYLAISDNGIGLNSAHLEAFETCDTRQKYALGGKGVGRLVWIKVFDKIDVESCYEVGFHDFEKINFRFDPQREDSLVNPKKGKGSDGEVGTKIILSEVKGDQNAAISPTILSRYICHHFFPYFIAGSMPRLYVQFGRRDINISEYLDSKIDNRGEVTVDVIVGAVGQIRISHVYVDKSISQDLSNSILLTAQGRVVQSVAIEKKFALRSLENGKAYVCVVKGAFLDARVDQERTGFKSLESEIEAIKEAALEAAEQFLESHIATVRTVQKRHVIEVLEEHPQLAVSVKNVDEYVSSLSPGMAEEDIGKTLFTLLYRHERKLKHQIDSISNSEAPTKSDQKQAIEALVDKVTDDAKRRLAEYTIKRHQIIQIARSLLRYRDEERRSYHWERTLHDLICPMGKMLSAKDYDEHNLWLIDDLLSYYSFFASDKAMSAFGISDERKEPDLIFLNPHGFRREGTNDPVVIIEFKRPGDENLSSDPVDQVLDYIERLRTHTVRDVQGQVVSDISLVTPFECIVICDLTESARRKFERSVAQTPTPDGLGYYGFSPNHKASIRVMSYSKLFRDAEMRNKSFFDRLGLVPEEVRKSLSAAAEAAE
ncbi:ATP-binding protein [Mesorhizobium sp. CU2]|uniref:ATP-binding protein n=1 Tax=unclassified Mesorhizobium TaxID=325217 RepID=UPI0011276DA6|nr:MULTISPECIES: ATP-binding protein [unclassified Mesorhizobium]TPN75961.1 ATP-binding protein [Mesorhizobium sp. CU3]TPO08867.1 ATP-binding protein [Mesorhizobium sp. CU2]